MKITFESTETILLLDGVWVRIWEGVTERGVRCCAAIAVVAAEKEEDQAEFTAELLESPPPSQPFTDAFVKFFLDGERPL